ncbi:uncharacterized protein LOC117254939 [Epinephelus lanceolatus]
MTAEVELGYPDGNQDLAQFFEEIPQMQRLMCHILQDVKPVLRLTTSNHNTPATISDHQRIHAALLQVVASSSRLERKLDHCLWTQKVFSVLVMGLIALWGFTLFIHYSTGHFHWTTAKN